jgi:hypothetical protein
VSAYWPGRLLARLHGDLREFERRDTGCGAAQFSTAATTFAVREVVDRHFLMHTVVAQFEYAVHAPAPGRSHIRVRHRGMLTRCGIEFESRSADAGPVQALRADAELATALMPLDFTRCELFGNPAGWRIELQHYGASEVVGRIPSLSRYVPLIASQRESLLAAFEGFERVLAGSGKFSANGNKTPHRLAPSLA